MPSPASTLFHDASEMPLESPAQRFVTPSTEPRALADTLGDPGNTPSNAEDTNPQATILNGSVHYSPVAERLPHSHDDAHNLTPLRAHYLKKSLISLQFQKELAAITTTHPAFPTLSPMSYLGSPFTPPPKGAPRMEMPFLRFLFRQFVLSFPFVASAPKDFFPQKLQPFIGSLLARNLSTTEDVLGMEDPSIDPEIASREKLLAKAEKYFGLLVGSATKLVEPEEVVRLSQKDLDRLEALAKKRAARGKRARDAFDVNIVTVRTVLEKSRIKRTRAHEEFIVRTRRANMQDVFVSRRYGDFKTLSQEVCVISTRCYTIMLILLSSCTRRIRTMKSLLHLQKTRQR